MNIDDQQDRVDASLEADSRHAPGTQDDELAKDQEDPEQREPDSQTLEPVAPVQPEMNINSDLTTLNFDGENSSSSDGRGPQPLGHAPGFSRDSPDDQGLSAPIIAESNYEMFLNTKKADQKYLNQFRRRQKTQQ